MLLLIYDSPKKAKSQRTDGHRITHAHAAPLIPYEARRNFKYTNIMAIRLNGVSLLNQGVRTPEPVIAKLVQNYLLRLQDTRTVQHEAHCVQIRSIIEIALALK